MSAEVVHGDCLQAMPTLPAESFDAVVTDPPYGLGFMGKDWDRGVPGVHFWQEALRLAKPGAFLVAFGGTRTFHRLTVAIEDAGWEIRDCLCWLYGSGFPKSLDVSKAIDKAAGATREVTGIAERRTGSTAYDKRPSRPNGLYASDEYPVTTAATDAAHQWEGWGTALKPAWEPIILARKPFKLTVASNVQEHGTGALNIDGCRIGTDDTRSAARRAPARKWEGGEMPMHEVTGSASGRWPANVVLDEEAARLLDEQTGELTSGSGAIRKAAPGLFGLGGDGIANTEYGDSGGASRFFYCAKASRSEREAGLEGFRKAAGGSNAKGYTEDVVAGLDRNRSVANNHPTVKPLALMRWLCRLVTPPGGSILDPFAGSGTTGCAAALEGFGATLIDKDADWVEISRLRIAHHGSQQILPL